MSRVFTLGMNIAIFVQTTLNAKRKKRRGKVVSLSKKPKLPRVIHILKTGKLKDRTHYREVDPYWGVMWRQYEYLRYLEFYLKKIVSEAIDKGVLDLTNSEDYLVYESYIKLLEELYKHKKKLVHWMFNAFHIQIGGVLSSRFYGWKQYASKFVGRFYEIAADLIQKLRFDIDKTRCSVYFYQAFWLGGLSVINEIREKLYKEKNVTPNFNRGTKIFSLSEFEDFDNIDFISPYVEGNTTTSNTEPDVSELGSDSNSDKNTTDIDSTVTKEEIILSNDELDQIETQSNLPIDDLDEHDEQQLKLKALEVLRNILKKSGIPLDVLYSVIDDSESKQNKVINLIASRIKKKLKKGEIKLTQQEKKVLSMYLGRVILV